MLNLILTFKSTFLVSPYTSRPTLLPSPTFPVSLYQRTHPIAKSYILRIPPPADPPYCSVLHIFPVFPYQPTYTRGIVECRCECCGLSVCIVHYTMYKCTRMYEVHREKRSKGLNCLKFLFWMTSIKYDRAIFTTSREFTDSAMAENCLFFNSS